MFATFSDQKVRLWDRKFKSLILSHTYRDGYRYVQPKA